MSRCPSVCLPSQFLHLFAEAPGPRLLRGPPNMGPGCPQLPAPCRPPGPWTGPSCPRTQALPPLLFPSETRGCSGGACWIGLNIAHCRPDPRSAIPILSPRTTFMPPPPHLRALDQLCGVPLSPLALGPFRDSMTQCQGRSQRVKPTLFWASRLCLDSAGRRTAPGFSSRTCGEASGSWGGREREGGVGGRSQSWGAWRSLPGESGVLPSWGDVCGAWPPVPLALSPACPLPAPPSGPGDLLACPARKG